MQILILGMHRSGTSSVTRLVNLMGAWAGTEAELIGANDENPKGFWERRDVIDANDALLHHAGCEWYDLTKWSFHGEENQPLDSNGLAAELKAIDNITTSLNTHSDWVIKDPRLCHTLPLWRAYLNQPVVVVVHRHPLEIAISLHTRNSMALAHGLALWEYAAVGMLNAAATLPTVWVDYAELMEQPIAATHRLHRELVAQGATGLHLPSDEAITDFIEPSLYRSKTGALELAASLTSHQQNLLAAITSRAPNAAHWQPSPYAAAAMSDGCTLLHHAEQLEALNETHSRAMSTIREQEQRIHELIAERDHAQQQLGASQLMQRQAEQNNEHLQLILEEQTQALGAAMAELAAIKSTRWWQLREKLIG